MAVRISICNELAAIIHEESALPRKQPPQMFISGQTRLGSGHLWESKNAGGSRIARAYPPGR